MIEDTLQIRMRFAWEGILAADWRNVWFGGICNDVILTRLPHVRQIAKGI